MSTTMANEQSAIKQPPVRVWWSNAILFVAIHIAACVGVYHYPYYATCKETLVLAFVCWQVACFGITIGYHRLYSHRSFEAGVVTRAFLALLGGSAFQGSIKWWVLRHRLHHRYTDDPVHDPYSATRGLLWSHMGWIFFRQRYERMGLIDQDDLEEDAVVRFQHKYYIPIALFSAFVIPAVIGSIWHDAVGALIWGGLVGRITVWHCTFLVNSLAHWDGLQPYSDENTSRVNLIVALLTGGEGNHNFHAFPQDFRSGPSLFDWDPSKWIILLLHRLGLAHGLRKARDEDLARARWRMECKHSHHAADSSDDEQSSIGEEAVMTAADVFAYVEENKGSSVLLINGAVVDATAYLHEHPGGALLLRKYAVKTSATMQSDDSATRGRLAKELHHKATQAFQGGMNKHSRAAHDKLRELTVARFEDD